MNTAAPQYDPGIIPTEVAARKEREGELFGKTAKTDKRDNLKAINTTGGYTLDQEGLANNYAVEPEMYISEPGDLRQVKEELVAKRAHELSALVADAAGRLTMKADSRYKGQGRL